MSKAFAAVCVLAIVSFLSGCPQPNDPKPVDLSDCVAPLFIVNGATVTGNISFSEPLTVTILSPTVGSSVRYTLDGAEPVESSNLYSEPIQINSSTTLKVRAYADGNDPSPVSVLVLEKSLLSFGIASGIHLISMASGVGSRHLDVPIAAPEAAVVHYTTDGSEPNESSSIYTGPIRLVSDTTIKARYWLSGEASNVYESSFELRYSFFAYNFTTNNVYQVYARRRASGLRSVFYIEEGQIISDAFLAECVSRFEEMYDLIESKFAEPSDVDGDGRVALLILDIKDGATATSGYIAGYFDPYNSLASPDSNLTDMLYMDWNPGNQYLDGFVSTMIHELQHLANFNNSYLQEGMHYQDTWVNEGLSSAAEYLYAGEHLADRIDYYNNQADYNGGMDTIAYGEGFVSWGSHYPVSDILAAYSTVYLFMQWLRIHDPAGSGVYKEIIDSNYYDHLAVVDAVSDWVPAPDWTTLIRSWYLANWLDDSSSLFGYKGELSGSLSLLPRALGANASGATLNLFPGEGVYLSKTSPYEPIATDPILYAGFNDSAAPAVDEAPPYEGDFLLAYNSSGDDGGPYVATAPLPLAAPVLLAPVASFRASSLLGMPRFRSDAIGRNGGALHAPLPEERTEYERIAAKIPLWK